MKTLIELLTYSPLIITVVLIIAMAKDSIEWEQYKRSDSASERFNSAKL